jgi:hypothetical protein
MADGILYSTNGSLVFEIGANNTTVNITNSISIGNTFANSTIIGGKSYDNPGLFAPNVNDPYWSFGSAANGFWGGNDTHHGFRIYDTNSNTAPFKVDGTGSVYFNKLTANGSLGTNGQVLTSNGSMVYWGDVSANSGGGSFTNGQSISVNDFEITGSFTANSSTGSAGQILSSNGSGVYWANVSGTFPYLDFGLISESPANISSPVDFGSI